MIIIKSKREIDCLRRSNQIVAAVFREIKKMVSPGITTRELDREVERLIRAHRGIPAFKGYKPPGYRSDFPASTCISVNEEVVHGIPGPRKLREGDIVSLDVGVLLDGYYGDAAVTLPVGNVSEEAKRLMEVAERALYLGIEKAKVGNRLSDISHCIQAYAEGNGFSVVRDFVGHGIGKSLHENPQIPNFGPPHQGPRLRQGMIFALEPMINAGTWRVIRLDDEWTVVTADGKLSAHFEHSIALTDSEPEILSMG
ncbi:MAG: type I methionyl aminopeptidase [Proteobacteria bacterium]|nr:type I methionyl aminopeptidase [Pseudomonadota bacterium]